MLQENGTLLHDHAEGCDGELVLAKWDHHVIMQRCPLVPGNLTELSQVKAVRLPVIPVRDIRHL